jgi:hypothetical protein
MTYIENFKTLKDKSLNILKSKFPNIGNNGLFGDNYKLIAIIIVIIVLLIICIPIFYISYKTTILKKSQITKMNNNYSISPSISSININNTNYKYLLRDYYIKSAYNACSAGNFKNDYVNIDALKICIKQGFRMLDFEIYSINDNPVVSTSSIDNYRTKETYNYIEFSKIINIINNYAFSSGTCPNPNDPLIIHLRIKSNNKKIYSKMSEIIYKNLEKKILGPKYSYENNGKNLGKIKLSELTGKIIFSVDKTNSSFEDTPFNEYVNIASHTHLLRLYTYNDIYNINNIDELTNYNKEFMTICIPNLSINVNNYSSTLPMKYGCQFVAMSAQGNDNYIKQYNDKFNKAGSAFILKPKNLRYIPVTIPPPKLPSKKLSYESRNISSSYYNFKI